MIAVFFGGRSCEHDISIITGLQALCACKRKAVGVYIDGDGVWWAAKNFDSVSAVRNKKFDGKKVHLRPADSMLYCKNKPLCKIDCALLCNHGMLGEDGALQGLLEMCGVPYTGSDVLSSALGMNKLMCKRVFERAGLPVLPYIGVKSEQYSADARPVIAAVEELGYPVIVKPCNLGSSIGIGIAKNREQLFGALRVAFEWDGTAVVEKALTDFTEVNCAVIGDSGKAQVVSETEQPVGWKEFLSFADKYSGDVKNERHKIPADIPPETEEEVKSLAARAFEAVGASGVARIDFMIKDGVFVNEINTIPGSLSSPLFESVLPLSDEIELLIEIAQKRKDRADGLKRVYTPLTPIAAK